MSGVYFAKKKIYTFFDIMDIREKKVLKRPKNGQIKAPSDVSECTVRQ